MDKYAFQYCQKIVVFSKDKKKVLLCKRKGENDYDGVFSFIGGKMETTDKDILGGLKREKDEEVGVNFKLRIYPEYSSNLSFTKKNGSTMILPHYYAIHIGGEINLSDEYSEYKWVAIDSLDSFEPKIPGISLMVERIFKLMEIADEKDFVKI